ncbi:hypothetical protein E2C01_042548 [Portunus trituberculatus]|uniref:Secreted protein n=1 Tax=Portunus trituberculatus TaxID=210409 RepID=A0A5B7FWT0_PORTR|nr:hypothetical protein [Portunus trituberculatus]
MVAVVEVVLLCRTLCFPSCLEKNHTTALSDKARGSFLHKRANAGHGDQWTGDCRTWEREQVGLTGSTVTGVFWQRGGDEAWFERATSAPSRPASPRLGSPAGRGPSTPGRVTKERERERERERMYHYNITHTHTHTHTA